MKLEQKARELRERKKGNITGTSAKKHTKKLNKKVYRRSSELLHGISRPTRVVAMTCQKISGLSRKGEREKKRLSPDALRCQFATLGARERGNWLVHIFFLRVSCISLYTYLSCRWRVYGLPLICDCSGFVLLSLHLICCKFVQSWCIQVYALHFFAINFIQMIYKRVRKNQDGI